MKAAILVCVLASLVCVPPLHAEMYISFSSYDLLPDRADQDLKVIVKGDGRGVFAVNIAVMIGNGKTDEVPNITGVAITGPGTLLGGPNKDLQFDESGWPGGYGGFWYASAPSVEGSETPTPLESGSVLAIVTINTVGYLSGSFDVLLKGINYPGIGIIDTQLLGEDGNPLTGVTIEDGVKFNVVPEPSSLLLLSLGVLGIGVVAVSRRKRTPKIA